MIIDVHCHILPDVDDGAKDGKSTKRMLELASSEGIGAIVATPHFVCGTDEAKVREMRAKFQVIRKWWKAKEPERRLYLGSELYYGEGIVEALEQGLAMTMNGTKYVLVEFPTYESFSYIQKAVQNLLYAGYFPIIAHVERYENIQKKEYIQELVDMGAYIQMNASAIMRKKGFWEKRYILSLLKCGLVHFIGTDAHDPKYRKPAMKECAQYLQKKIGIRLTQQILEENPEKMLKGEKL